MKEWGPPTPESGPFPGPRVPKGSGYIPRKVEPLIEIHQPLYLTRKGIKRGQVGCNELGWTTSHLNHISVVLGLPSHLMEELHLRKCPARVGYKERLEGAGELLWGLIMPGLKGQDHLSQALLLQKVGKSSRSFE